MEFFFLTQNVSLEIVVLIIIVLVLIGIWSHELYIRIGNMWTIIKEIKRTLMSKKVISEIPLINKKETKTDDIKKGKHEVRAPKEIIEETIEVADIPQIEKTDTSQVEKLTNLVSSVRTLIARGMAHEAQTLIVEGLSIEKDNRDLNLLLGQIYEQEGQYEKAEYIYKDMAELHSNDIEILEKLANVLIIEKKNIVANEIYKKIHTLTGNTETTLYMLTHISNTLHDDAATLHFAKQYVLQWPKNPEIIALLANVQVSLGMRKDAIETYKNLKNLTPYSSEITETLQKLLLEEELANNFRGKE